MTQEEQIRLYRLMEKLNWFFHQEMHYLNREDVYKRQEKVLAMLDGPRCSTSSRWRRP